MPIYIGEKPIKAMYLGDKPVKAVYLGDNLGWSAFTHPLSRGNISRDIDLGAGNWHGATSVPTTSSRYPYMVWFLENTNTVDKGPSLEGFRYDSNNNTLTKIPNWANNLGGVSGQVFHDVAYTPAHIPNNFLADGRTSAISNRGFANSDSILVYSTVASGSVSDQQLQVDRFIVDRSAITTSGTPLNHYQIRTGFPSTGNLPSWKGVRLALTYDGFVWFAYDRELAASPSVSRYTLIYGYRAFGPTRYIQDSSSRIRFLNQLDRFLTTSGSGLYTGLNTRFTYFYLPNWIPDVAGDALTAYYYWVDRGTDRISRMSTNNFGVSQREYTLPDPLPDEYSPWPSQRFPTQTELSYYGITGQDFDTNANTLSAYRAMGWHIDTRTWGNVHLPQGEAGVSGFHVGNNCWTIKRTYDSSNNIVESRAMGYVFHYYTPVVTQSTSTVYNPIGFLQREPALDFSFGTNDIRGAAVLGKELWVVNNTTNKAEFWEST